MGQGQSSQQQDSASAAEQSEAKTDYYILLGIERTATDDEYDAALLN